MSGRTVTTILAAVTALTLAGCGSSSIATTADATPTGGSSTPPASSPPTAAPAKVGSTITLKGANDGEQIAVTLVKVDLKAHSTDGFTTPSAGNKFVAIQWRIKNTGTAAYDDSPSNGSSVADAQGQQFDSALVVSISSGPLLPSSLKVPPGGQALGYIVYEVAKASTVTTAQFGTNSGFGSTGQWSLK